MAERSAEEEDQLAWQGELTERIRHRKAELERKKNEQKMKEMELMAAEQSRLREEAEAEKLTQKQRAEALEAELRRAREESDRLMRSSLMVRASDCQCTSCNGPGFDPSIRRHSGI